MSQGLSANNNNKSVVAKPGRVCHNAAQITSREWFLQYWKAAPVILKT